MGSQAILTVGIVDTGTGEGGGCSSAIVTKEPTKSYGAMATEREWVIFCNCFQENDITYTPVA